MRYALVSGRADDRQTIARYLPSNYRVVGPNAEGDAFLIEGTDSAGWTLDGYVIPRLQSGLFWAKEVEG